MAEGRSEQGRDHPQYQSAEDADAAATILERVKARLAGVRATVVRRPGGLRVWRVIVAVVGSAVVAVGAILLVLPGPGWVVIFLGVGIWATEFAWARSLLGYARRQVHKWTVWFARQPRRRVVMVGVAGLMVIAVVVWFAVE